MDLPRSSRLFAALLLAVAILAVMPAPGLAFSVLAHQAIVDQNWNGQLVQSIRERFPNVTEQDLADAHDYARGGSHIQDLGYFPFGSRLFSDLLHYVRTGDFVSRSIAEARTPQEYAFALGALDHYEADAYGHPLATNLAVPILYPKIEKAHGDTATYEDSPSAHLETEFRFDVLQVAHREEVPDLFEHSIEFKVPRDFLERVFRETYGFSLDDLFENYDVAIGTYRWGFRALINEATGVSWELYRNDIESLEPGATKDSFVREISRGDFEQEFGKVFREPGYFARFFGVFAGLVPNIGPLARLPYKPLPPSVQQLYFSAAHKAAGEYRNELERVANDELYLPNLNLDTGRASKAGEYPMADKTYAELLRRHAQNNFADMPNDLALDMAKHFQNREAALRFDESGKDRAKTVAAVDRFESAMQRRNASAMR